MSQVIRIPDHVFKRLETYAKGFDTPGNVIERMLDFYEQNQSHKKSMERTEKPETTVPATRLDIAFKPEDPNDFKRKLLHAQKANIKLYFTDGSTSERVWNASKFSKDSNLLSNLRSGYLRGWKDKGINRAELSIIE